MHSVVIADTSCFILLTKIEELELLKKVYPAVYTTPEVASEFKYGLPDWVIIQEVKDKNRVSTLQIDLDRGEASAIALAYELPDSIVILDDWGARKVATRLHIAFTGTFGVIIKAKQNGIIPSVIAILNKVRLTNFRISEDVLNEIIREAGE